MGDVFGLSGRIGFRCTVASWSSFLILDGGRAVFSRTSTLNQLLFGSWLWFTLSLTKRIFLFSGGGVNEECVCCSSAWVRTGGFLDSFPVSTTAGGSERERIE